MSGDKKFLEPFNNGIGKFDPALLSLQKTVDDNPVQVERLTKMLELKKEWLAGPVAIEMKAREDFDQKAISQEKFEEILKEGLGKIAMDKFRKYTAEAVEMEENLNVERISENERLAERSKYWALWGLSSSMVLAAVLLWRTLKNAVKKIELVTHSLNQTSESLFGKSGELQQSSSTLTEAVELQASSLQETSASITQITETVNGTTDKTKSAAEAVNEATHLAQDGRKVVTNLLNAIGDIQSSNDNISHQMDENNNKINNIVSVIGEINDKTKVINDIVFQTKLLSFNASVEAARAGEQGKGFAVVAEEVGNLAAMSGEASKLIQSLLERSKQEVADMVEETQNRTMSILDNSRQIIDDGSEIATQCGRSFEEISEKISQLSQITHDISQASAEQNMGVGQIKDVISELDSVTHENSSTAKRSSYLSEALAHQSQEMARDINELCKFMGIVKGSDGEAVTMSNESDNDNDDSDITQDFKLSA